MVNSGRAEIAAKPEEVFSLADKLTGQVSDWLQATPTKPLLIGDATTKSYEAYASYEKGMQCFYRMEHSAAIRHFAQAIRIDSTFAKAHLRLAISVGVFQTMNLLSGVGLERARASLARARQFGQSLLERDKKFIRAWEAVLMRDARTSGSLFKELMIENPQEKEYYFWYAMMCQVQGRFDEGATVLEKAIELDRTYSDAYNIIAFELAQAHNFGKAISYINTYVALLPDAANPYDSGVEIYVLAGKPDEALKMAEEGLRRVPNWYYSYNRQAQVYVQMGEFEKARERFRVRANLDSTFTDLEEGVALTWLYEGRLNEAIAYFRRRIKSSTEKNNKTGELWARFSLAKILMGQGATRGALDEFGIVEQLSKETRKGAFSPWPFMVAYYSGLCEIRRGDLSAAGARAEMIRALTKESGETYYESLYNGLMANIHLAAGRAQEAEAAFKKTTFWIQHSFPRFRMLGPEISARLGDQKRALETYDDTYNHTLVLTTAVYGGDAVDCALERPKLDYYKALMYEHFGDKTMAIKFYEKAIFNWRNADKDYANLVDSQSRLAKLKGL